MHAFTLDQLQACIKLEKLWSHVPEEQRQQYLHGKISDKAPVLDLLNYGYAKLIGKGRLHSVPIIVNARYVSADAERKVKDCTEVNVY